ncbi:MAG TPA: DUF3108 domain-containing protein [Burkholderiales bacterium]|nr:DUF3108 domain-containing protein [Burkholderiales bacterium]
MKPSLRQHGFTVALACLIGLIAPHALGAPKTVKANYNAFMNGLSIGTINEQFEADAGRYRIVSDTKPLGLAALIQRQPLRFSSVGRVAREGLLPKQFEARRTPTDEPEVTAEFNWEQAQLMLKHDGKTESLSLPAATQDRLSVMYQFMYLPLEKSRELHVPMTNGRKLDSYRYRITRDVEVETGIGRLKTVHLVKIRDPGDPANEVWLSPQHHYFPVKMTIVERDGVRFEQIIQSLEVRD